MFGFINDEGVTFSPKVKVETPKVELHELTQKPEDSPFECFGCSS